VGVDEGGSMLLKRPERSRTGSQSGKAKIGRGNRRRTPIKTGERRGKSGAEARWI